MQPQHSDSAQTVTAPSGTVTFLFTDIEGSTQRWDRNRVAMEAAVGRHDRLARAVVAARAGYVFKTVGDSFCCAFSRPENAAGAALDLQRALAAEDFSAIDGLLVRIALHTGTADERDGDYFGPTVNRVSRLMGVANGGQVIMSGVTQSLVSGAMPHVSFRDLGVHRLKDLARAEQVFQLVAPGLRSDFPALRSLAAMPNNLPTEVTSFVGRDHEVAEVTALLHAHRLVTLVGSGGVGKTRTTLQVAANMLEGLRDGVWFVELAALTDGSLIPSAIANALGIELAMDEEPVAALVPALQGKTMLLVFDNCEHVIDAAATTIAAILQGAPHVNVLASSRQSLGITGEQTYRMPSLAVPNDADAASLGAERALGYGGIALFVDRARSADERFALSDATAPIVADIVRRIDGIPLAIELAASRVKVLNVRQIDTRLDERFRILRGARRDVLPRQQTLHALIDWSYDLLDQREKTLFARLGTFVDGFTLDAAVAVCADELLDEFDLFDVLASLVDKSLVVAELTEEPPRYRLLLSTRDYALEKLTAAGERETLAGLHLAWVGTLVTAAREREETTLREDAIEALVSELGNIRAAIAWARESGDVDSRALIVGQVAARARRNFGSLAEWLAQIEHVIQALPEDRTASLAWLYRVASIVVGNAGRRNESLALSEKSVAFARRSGDPRLLSVSLITLAGAYASARRFEEAALLLVEADELAGADLAPGPFVRYHLARAFIALHSDKPDESIAAYEQIIAKYRSLGSPMRNAEFFTNLAEAEHRRGNTARAIEVANESLASIASQAERAHVLMNLAGYLVARDELAAARASAEESLTLFESTAPDSPISALALEHLALVIALEGDPARAARILGYTVRRLADAGFEREHTERVTYGRLRELLAARLAREQSAACEAEGLFYTHARARREASGTFD